LELKIIVGKKVVNGILFPKSRGLDSSSMTSCVTLIRELAVRQGRTVICTIHQPSALIFEQFSHLYCVAEGRTIYQGKPAQLTEHFLDHGLRCPPYHNPADFRKFILSFKLY
jgi:ABC-type multidrug transport system ATPase subunit